MTQRNYLLFWYTEPNCKQFAFYYSFEQECDEEKKVGDVGVREFFSKIKRRFLRKSSTLLTGYHMILKKFV